LVEVTPFYGIGLSSILDGFFCSLSFQFVLSSEYTIT